VRAAVRVGVADEAYVGAEAVCVGADACVGVPDAVCPESAASPVLVADAVSSGADTPVGEAAVADAPVGGAKVVDEPLGEADASVGESDAVGSAVAVRPGPGVWPAMADVSEAVVSERVVSERAEAADGSEGSDGVGAAAGTCSGTIGGVMNGAMSGRSRYGSRVTDDRRASAVTRMPDPSRSSWSEPTAYKAGRMPAAGPNPCSDAEPYADMP
jgi:hypothetical protein